VIGAPWTITPDLVKVLGIDKVVSGSDTKMNERRRERYVGVADPYQQIKQLGIYSEIETSALLSTDNVIERIVENRMKYVGAYKHVNQRRRRVYLFGVFSCSRLLACMIKHTLTH
jgi:hypothetical protein